MNKKPIFILSLDGGGIKGIIISQFLKRLEENLQKSLYHTFDMFAGTSTGAFIVSSIAYKKMTGADIVDKVYTVENAKKIMPPPHCLNFFRNFKLGRPKYDGNGKTQLLKKYFKDTDLITDTDKNVIIVGFDVTARKPKFFKSWGTKAPLIPILNISSAAPTYFPSVFIPDGNIWGIDGGVCANNPTDCAYADALKIYGKDANIKILSIGTGIPYPDASQKGKESTKWGGLQWLIKGNILEMLVEGPQACTNYRMETFSSSLGHKYLRINGPLKNTKLDDISTENIQVLREVGDLWWEMYQQETLNLLTPLRI